MGLKLPPSQLIHQKKAYALQNKKMHVNKALPVNLAIFREDVLRACRATFLLSYTPQRAISLIIHELQHQKDAKFFTFFHFF